MFDPFHIPTQSEIQSATAPAGEGWYRGFRIVYWPPPVPFRDMDWQFHHDDFDGAEDAHDHRYGHGASPEDCARQIDDMLEGMGT